ncbi:MULTISPECIES: DUF305 domain-containing protein [unclassified Frigoribacterium]|uniref:DUF305 domain-containing protein n=1 Tax=unclassified Frigoribacterium TaxID=2627005 RepID=UPI0006F46BF0|nr:MULTISPECIES: DUF305 domain-containing protein [unclassified Frigoribacterium]KQM27524.1 hypothetical protein ASL10_04060 [Frigoribacterium sp. Leaf8]MBD8140489.1 DUF305 domain-containing protein [Frigoribacterium sp. CFBP 13605]ROS53735.1 uncharacterized protein (DUF305 family) [Frigoribacterium sp. PhB118]VXC07610.1 conserved exported hypothetical protein [Frigoribacterium sp. 9N]
MHTTTTTRTLAIAASLTLGLTLASCSTNDSSSDAGSSASSSSAASAHDDQDVMFAQMMLPHHEQAVEMSDALLAKGDGVDPDVATLAEQIKAEQGPEIIQLASWLQGWGEPTESGHSMSGMMSDSDMTDLDQASAKDAGKLFLQQMVQHHEGAVDMARSEVDKGMNTDAVAMAKSIVSSQTEQITQMKDMLAST